MPEEAEEEEEEEEEGREDGPWRGQSTCAIYATRLHEMKQIPPRFPTKRTPPTHHKHADISYK
eukprot:6345128-Pyramimonas_sp.AAC.1